MRSHGWSPGPAGCVLVRRDTRVCPCVLSLFALSEARLFRECGQAGRVLSSGTQPHWTGIWDVQPLGRQEICFLISVTQPVMCFVTVLCVCVTVFCYGSPTRLMQLYSVGQKGQGLSQVLSITPGLGITDGHTLLLQLRSSTFRCVCV